MTDVTGSILATYEPEDEEQPTVDVRIWFAARGDLRLRTRYYHPNDPDGPEPADIEFDSCDIVDRRGSPIAGAKVTPELEAWAIAHLATRHGEAEGIAQENSGPDPDYLYERKRDEGW
jgi:hypothetical protein